MKIGNILRSLALAGAFTYLILPYPFLKGERTFQGVSQHPADQVFKNHNGYSVIFTDKNKKVNTRNYIFYGNVEKSLDHNYNLNDKNFSQFIDLDPVNPEDLEVYKDLKKGERRYVRIANFHDTSCMGIGCSGYGEHNLRHIEIHLPEDSKLSPGSETYGGKYKKTERLEEIE